MGEQAVENGVELKLCWEVASIKKEGENFVITGKNEEVIEAKFVVNAAGVYSDTVANMIGDESFSINSSRGQYYLLDKSQGELFNHVMFQCPGPLGKGVLVAPTVHGNLIVGPDANPGCEKDDVSTDRNGLANVVATSKKTTTAVNFRECIRNFAGLRSEPSTHDFIVGFSETDDHFMNIAGIKSPGLSAAPAIAVDAVRMLLEAGVPSEKKENFIGGHKHLRFKELSDEEKAAAIADVGADMIVGSLIKNPGGGMAESGGYLVGTAKAVELASYRLTSVGVGKEVGCSLNVLRNFYKGLFYAPHTVMQAIKTAHFAAYIFDRLGYTVEPAWNEVRPDIIQSVITGSAEGLCAFCRGIQAGSPVDAFVAPEPWAMPGYNDPVVMAAGTFVSGASIELSADAPIRAPYTAFFQGGLTYESGKYGIMTSAEYLLKELEK